MSNTFRSGKGKGFGALEPIEWYNNRPPNFNKLKIFIEAFDTPQKSYGMTTRIKTQSYIDYKTAVAAAL